MKDASGAGGEKKALGPSTIIRFYETRGGSKVGAKVKRRASTTKGSGERKKLLKGQGGGLLKKKTPRQTGKSIRKFQGK